MLGAIFRQSTRSLVTRSAQLAKVKPTIASFTRLGSNSHPEQDPEFDDRWEQFFNKEDIDKWELKSGLNSLAGYDLVPEPRVCIAALKAARRLDDFAIAVRIIEIIRYKSAGNTGVYNYVMQEIRPVLEEMGVPEPDKLGLVGNDGKIFGPGNF
ncbi:cytochrome c oxidase subunit 5A, mitochondrial-like [Convolutriloba macropyga]|uniref:cytochrome c oxidase subunit 5A, mitochondrial-like n=1 Tax=Convolutriloba macropyga TaxID=536237 RepID=UPI003F52338C